MSVAFENESQELVFKPNDKVGWNEKEGIMYVLSCSSHQFVEIKTSLDSMKE